jgi:hypothetical protein
MSATILSLPEAAQQETKVKNTPVEKSLARHTFFDERPSWDRFGVTLFTQDFGCHDDLTVAAQGLVLPNKVNLRLKTQPTLFPIELGGIVTERNLLTHWLGPNYAIPLRALSSRTMAQQPTFNHAGWERRKPSSQSLMARFEIARQDNGTIDHIQIYAWVVETETGKPIDEQNAAKWNVSNRF